VTAGNESRIAPGREKPKSVRFFGDIPAPETPI
jgi:hypothetical protein